MFYRRTTLCYTKTDKIATLNSRRKKMENRGMTVLDEQWARGVLPRRRPADHKGRYGRLLLFCGSRQYRGAAVLACGGALRCGAGMVRLAAVETVCAAAAAQLPCCTFWPMAENAQGGLDPAGLEEALRAGNPTAILAGCGLGNTPGTAGLVRALLLKAPCPLVLDADALNVLAPLPGAAAPHTRANGMLELLDAAAQPVVLTPHIGEMARLCGQPAEEVLRRRRDIARAFAEAHRCVVVLKSHITVVAAPGGGLYLNDRGGNPGLAKGGSGDVLAGVIAGLLAQGLAGETAAGAGVWLHAAAAESLAAESGYAGLCPAQLPAAVAETLHRMGF
jgi:NAD(P)H-hydrate epimerase